MVATLLDTMDLTERVKLGKVEIQMRGLYAEEVFFLLVDFPALRVLFDKSGGKPVTEEEILKSAPLAIYQAIAMSDCGIPRQDDGRVKPDVLKRAADKVRKMPVGQQLKLARTFFDLTFADGIGPFVEDWLSLTSRFNELTTSSSTQSREPGASRTVSPVQSSGSVVVDLPRNGRLQGLRRASSTRSATSSKKSASTAPAT